MTAIFQALGLAQAGGMPVGIKNSSGSGLKGETIDFERQMELLADQLGISLESLTPQMMEELEQWFMGGMTLPLGTAMLQQQGESLPGFASFANAMEQSMRGLGQATDLAGQAIEADADDALAMLPLKPSMSKTPLAQSVINGLQSIQADLEQNDGILPAATLANSTQSASTSTQIPKVLASNLLSMNVPQSVGGPGWGQAIGERLMWMVKGDQQVAELKITPPNLGPMEVKLTVNNDQASVAFLSNHAAVRDALEAAIPRLRDMMAQESLQLVNVDVGSRQQQAESRGDGGGAGNGGSGNNAQDQGVGDSPEGAVAGSERSAGLGLVDLFV